MKPSSRPPRTPYRLSHSGHHRPRLFAMVALLVLIAAVAIVPGAWAAGKFKVLYSFKGTPDGELPSGALILDAAGNLYGPTVFGGNAQQSCSPDYTGCGTVFELKYASGKWTESVLYSFCPQGNCPDGANPGGSLIFDSAGSLYGATTAGGGGTQQCSSGTWEGCGVVFKLTPSQGGSWTEEVLYAFQINSGGAGPNGGLLFDKAGNIYGTAAAAGNRCGDIYGWGGGVVFELIPGSSGWSENVLYSFCSQSNCTDGNAPYAGLTWGADGALYGTTAFGGTGFEVCVGGCGTAFKLTPGSKGKWREKVLHAMKGADGAEPVPALTADSQGNLYGTTSLDGAFGFGTVFQLTHSGGKWRYHVLYNFKTGSFYGSFATRPVLDRAGNIYGTIWTAGDGNCEGLSCGLVYKLTPGSKGVWKYSVIHSFSGSDGGFPSGDLLLDSKGNLYGTTEIGGAAGYGVIFEITP